MPSPDIEIYLQHIDSQTLLAWLQTRFPDNPSAAKPAGKHQWKLNVCHQGVTIPVLLIENASSGFTSLWFDSDQTPWADDQACARELFAHFQTEVRATPGSWQEGDDPDLWWHINTAGEGLIQWID